MHIKTGPTGLPYPGIKKAVRTAIQQSAQLFDFLIFGLLP